MYKLMERLKKSQQMREHLLRGNMSTRVSSPEKRAPSARCYPLVSKMLPDATCRAPRCYLKRLKMLPKGGDFGDKRWHSY